MCIRDRLTVTRGSVYFAIKKNFRGLIILEPDLKDPLNRLSHLMLRILGLQTTELLRQGKYVIVGNDSCSWLTLHS